MNIKKELNDLCNACIKHFDEISSDGSKRIRVFSITLESRDIWGGNGELDTTETIYITKDGWLSETITTETGLYQKSNPVIKTSSQKLLSEDVEKILNGDKVSMYDVIELTVFYQNTRNKYLEDFYI